MYLQVLTIADVVKGSGNQITTYAAEGKRNPTQPSQWKWPSVPYPPLAAWAKLCGAIKKTFLNAESRFLKTPLGKWMNKPHQKWTWYLDQHGEFLYEVNNGKFYTHPSFGRKLRDTTCHNIKI